MTATATLSLATGATRNNSTRELGPVDTHLTVHDCTGFQSKFLPLRTRIIEQRTAIYVTLPVQNTDKPGHSCHIPSNQDTASLMVTKQKSGSRPASLVEPAASQDSQQRKRHVTFGPYLVGSTLGEGEFGKVKMGWTRPPKTSNEVPRQVAIKLIRRNTIVNNAEREIKVYREINALKHLKHPNIIRLEEVLQNSKYIGIVLEYASGGEFYKYIQRKRRLDENSACKIFAELVSGVAYMHAKGLVHRDLKLENMLLDSSGDLLITDFGFVNEFRRGHELMSTSCGSPCYAAPELVVTTRPYRGRCADIWSCGIILFAMLAGYLPWDDDPTNPKGDDIPKLYHYITHTKLKFPSYISALPRDLLRKLLVTDPRKRVDMAHIVAHPWLKPHHDFLAVTPSEWDNMADRKLHSGVSKRSSTVATSTTTNNKLSHALGHSERKARGTSLVMDSTFKPSRATQHTYQRDILAESPALRERGNKLDPVLEEEKTRRRDSAASAALKAVFESGDDLSPTPSANTHTHSHRISDSTFTDSRDIIPPVRSKSDISHFAEDTISSSRRKSTSGSTHHQPHTIQENSSHNNDVVLSSSRRKPRPATYHLTLHSTTPDTTLSDSKTEVETSKISLAQRSNHAVDSNSLLLEDSEVTANVNDFSKNDFTPYTIVPNTVSELPENNSMAPLKEGTISNIMAISHSLDSSSKVESDEFTPARERPVLRDPVNVSSESRSRKRFSFLSFAASYSSSKTTMHTDSTSSSSVNSVAKHHTENPKVRSRSGTHTSSVSNHTTSGRLPHDMTPSVQRTGSKPSLAPSAKATPNRNIRASVMVSSLPTSNTQDTPQRGANIHQSPKDTSRTRKVLDFFKRRSMRI